MESAGFVSFGSISSPQPAVKFYSGFGRSCPDTEEISSKASVSDITDTKARSKGLFENDLSSESVENGATVRDVTHLENALLENLSQQSIFLVTQDLRNEFYRGLSMYTDQNDVVQLVRHFETACEEHYFKLEKYSQSSAGASRILNVGSILRLLKAEKLAWRWLWTLIECRQEAMTNSMPKEPLDGWITDSDVFHFMLKFDNRFRELRALVRCLEYEAVEWTDDTVFNFGEKIDFLWTNTRDCIRKNEKNYSTLLVNELDPDAPFRQERSIKDVDAVKQEAVFKTVFNLIRIGHIDEAIVLSQRQGSQWLSAILAGGRLSRCIDGSNSTIENAFTNEGDMNRRLYNKVCTSVAKEASLSPTERAIYGALSGFLPATLLGCSTWEDHLWAFASASSEKLFIDFLTLVRMKAPAETAKFLDEACFAELKDMFQRFILHSAEKFSSEDDIAPYRLIPLFFNLEAYDKLLDALNSWKRFVQRHEQILLWNNLHRFVCHVTIVFHLLYRAPITSPVHRNESEHENLAKIGSPFSCDYFSLPDCITTIQGYLDLLAADKEILLYPHYAVFLPQGSHVSFVADFLYDIASDEDRKVCLSVIENCELNVLEICRTVVQNVIDNLLPSPLSAITDAVTSKGFAPQLTSKQVMEVVRSLLFLQSIPDLRFDAISQACLMARRFLLLQMFTAASEVFSRVPPDFVKSAVKFMPSSDEDEDAWKVCQNRLREYNCLREYSNAYSAFRDWSDMFFNQKPEDATCSTVHDASMSTSKWQQTERERTQAMERWNADSMTYFEIAELTMRQILIGTDGEWLVDVHKDDDTLRRQEMIALRKRCIPLVAETLLFMYQSMKQYDKVLPLSEIIADESGKLYQMLRRMNVAIISRCRCQYRCVNTKSFDLFSEEEKERIRQLREGDPYFWTDWRLLKRFSISRRTLHRILKNESTRRRTTNEKPKYSSKTKPTTLPLRPMKIYPTDGPFMTIYKQHQNWLLLSKERDKHAEQFSELLPSDTKANPPKTTAQDVDVHQNSDADKTEEKRAPNRTFTSLLSAFVRVNRTANSLCTIGQLRLGSLLLNLLLSSFGSAELNLLTWKQLNDGLRNACHVVALEPPCDSASSKVLDGLAKSWNHVKEVRFCRLRKEEMYDPSLVDLKPKLEESGCFPVVIMPKVREDRVCLLKPILPKKPKGYLWNDMHNIEKFLRFINFLCGTFYNKSGEVSSEGKMYLQYRSSLHKLSDGPSLLTLSEACHSRNLTTFFRGEGCPVDKSTGTAPNDNIPEIPKCEELSVLPDRDEFEKNYLGRSKPVIFKKAITDWPAFQKWTNAFLRKTFGNKTVHVKLSPNGIFEGVEPTKDWNVAADLLRIPEEVKRHLAHPELLLVRPASNETLFSDFLDFISKKGARNSMSAYLEYTSIRGNFKSLEEDIDPLPFLGAAMRPVHLNIWISNGNTLGKLHFDEYENFLCQLRGRKQVILTDPQSNDRLHEGYIVEAMLTYKNGTFSRDKLLQSTALTMSPIDITYPDFEKFPSLRDLKWLNCTIEPGDVLYMPSFWWHEVQSYPDVDENRNLAVNFWYRRFWDKEFPCAKCPFELYLTEPTVHA
ncbi:hypothetical protein M514_01322 [Trichuris suis]|uniref:JmjC domain-containing protein n=1 Tax=Trichuris suis TaxID=68888 RepID=A0A085NS18_9BILA|nr:hypothetical protein M514_01322 [Trichuris suis]